jgi:hypothetical protein
MDTAAFVLALQEPCDSLNWSPFPALALIPASGLLHLRFPWTPGGAYPFSLSCCCAG